MPTRYRVLPYRQGSRGASALARALGGLCLRVEGSTFRPRVTDVIINWGRTQPYNVPRVPGIGVPQVNVLNLPEDIVRASNKRTFFQLMAETGNEEIIPRFWTNRNEIPDDAFPIVCRTVLAGHSGEGIVIADTRNDLVNAPLYVQYVKKQDEYRVHVGLRNDQSIIIAVQQKRRRAEHAEPNWQVRNHANGFIYARENVAPPQEVLDVAIRALQVTGLDFGAVDVIYNSRQRRAFVLEVNTAPGLEGQTVEDYARFFRGE